MIFRNMSAILRSPRQKKQAQIMKGKDLNLDKARGWKYDEKRKSTYFEEEKS